MSDDGADARRLPNFWISFGPRSIHCPWCAAQVPGGILHHCEKFHRSHGETQHSDARRVAPLDPRLEWQPIETLPIVGLFLLGRAGTILVDIGWNDSRRPYGIETATGDIRFAPTHWMPLPDPLGEAQRIPAPPDAHK